MFVPMMVCLTCLGCHLGTSRLVACEDDFIRCWGCGRELLAMYDLWCKMLLGTDKQKGIVMWTDITCQCNCQARLYPWTPSTLYNGLSNVVSAKGGFYHCININIAFLFIKLHRLYCTARCVRE
jgi:hypothetical protein